MECIETNSAGRRGIKGGKNSGCWWSGSGGLDDGAAQPERGGGADGGRERGSNENGARVCVGTDADGGCGYYASFARELAKVRQRLTQLENMVQLLEPGTPYSQYLVRGEDGTVIAMISVLSEIGKVSASVMVPMHRDTPPLDQFLVPYLEGRMKEDLVIGYNVQSEGAMLKKITATICTDQEVKSLMIKELLGKIRWTLAKMHRNENLRQAKEGRQQCA